MASSRPRLIFAFAHVLTISGRTPGRRSGWPLVGFGSRIPIAIALGWLFVRRRTMWASFGLHAAFNGILLVIAEIVVARSDPLQRRVPSDGERP